MGTQNKYKKSKQKIFSSSQKIISILYLLIFVVILLVVLCFNWIPHCSNKNLLLPNIVSLLISLIVSCIFYYIFKNIHIDRKTFRTIVIVTFSILYLAQLFVLYFSYFKTGWDAYYVNTLADQVAEQGTFTTAGSDPYLTISSNNILIVAILAFIKSLPIIGSKYFTILAINALLVNIAGILTCLTIKNLISNKAGIMSIFITTPLLLLSPWIIVPYSDTFTIAIPILIFFIYISTKKWWKYGFILFFGIIGYSIKPTTIIMLIAILFIELLNRRWRKPKFNQTFWLRTLAITNGIFLAFLIKYVSYSHINYHQVEDVTQTSAIHYLAMGQNDATCGQFSQSDFDEMSYGTEFEIQKFCNRIVGRSFKDQATFFTKKLLTNFNDGTFAWEGEGSFYYEVPERNNLISDTITSFYRSDKKYNSWFIQLEQSLWLFVLLGCIFMVKKSPSREESVLELSLIGLFFFVMLFEARARYLFCFAPIFITCAMLGFYNFKEQLINNPKLAKIYKRPKKKVNRNTSS